MSRAAPRMPLPDYQRPFKLPTVFLGSLKRLAIDYIDLYQLHWPNSSIPIAETMSAMDRLVVEGKVRFTGVSNFSVAQAATKNRIVSNQVPYSLVNRGIERDMLPLCQENGVTVIVYSPLEVGHPEYEDFRPMVVKKRLRNIRSRLK